MRGKKSKSRKPRGKTTLKEFLRNGLEKLVWLLTVNTFKNSRVLWIHLSWIKFDLVNFEVTNLVKQRREVHKRPQEETTRNLK